MRIIDAHVHIDRFLWDQHVDLSAPPPSVLAPHEVIAQLDDNGVDRAVIMQHPEGSFNDAVAQAIRDYPGRFRGAMIVPLDDTAVVTIERAHAAGLTAIKIDMFGTGRLYPGTRLDSDVLRRIYRTAQKRGIVVTIDPFRVDGEGYQPEVLERMVRQHPDLKFVVCHLGFCDVETLRDAANLARWRRMAALAHHENVWFDVSAMPDMFAAAESYPYLAALRFVRDFADEHGAHKLLWGSDILGELQQATYRQLIDMFTGSDLFTDAEKQLIMHDNSNLVYFDGAASERRPAPAKETP